MTIPQELKQIDRWVIWRYEVSSKGKKATKVPYRAKGGRADKTNPEHWSTYDECVEACDRRGMTGVGICLGEDLIGIDLDDCLDVKGNLKEWARPVVCQLNSYTEVSPSGYGLKCIAFGSKPEGYNTIAKLGDGQVEVYANNSAYFTITGNVWDGQDRLSNLNIDDLCEDLLKKNQLAPAAAIPKNVPLSTKEGRCWDEVKLIKEQGNDGSKRLFACCCRCVEWDLNEQSTIAMIRRAEELLPFPRNYSDAQILSRASQAEDKVRRGIKLVGLELSSPLINKIAAMPSINGVARRLTGVIGDTVEWMQDTARIRHPEFAIAAALTAWGTILGRRVKDPNNTRTNIYSLMLGATSSGKDSYMKAAERLINTAEVEAGKTDKRQTLYGGNDIASRQAFLRHLEASLAKLWILDEADGLFSTMKNARNGHLARLPDDLKVVYSNANNPFWRGCCFADISRSIDVCCPHACLLAVSQPKTFFDCLSGSDTSGGLIGRFLIFSPMVQYRSRNLTMEQIPLPENVLNSATGWLRGWDQLRWAGDSTVEFSYDDLAKQRLDNFTDENIAIMSASDADDAAAIGKASEHAAKVALISAAANAGPYREAKISVDDVEFGKAVASYSSHLMQTSIRDNVSESRFERQAKKILSYGRQLGEASPRSMYKKFHLREREFEEIISVLREAGEVEDVYGNPTKDGRPGRRKLRFTNSSPVVPA